MVLPVAESDGGDTVAYALGEPNRQDLRPFESELVAIHVLREFRGRGLGRRLFAAVSEGLYAKGSNSLFLWVLAENPACSFYENLGGRQVAIRGWQNNDYFGTKIQEVAYGWMNLANLFQSTHQAA